MEADRKIRNLRLIKSAFIGVRIAFPIGKGEGDIIPGILNTNTEPRDIIAPIF
jgi:hypothetical protein